MIILRGFQPGHSLILCIAIILKIVYQVDEVFGQTPEDEIFDKYRPLAMDESWSLERGRPNPSGVNSFDALEQSFNKYPSEVESYPSNYLATETTPDVKSIDGMLTSVEDYNGQNISDTLFALPNAKNPKLTSKLTTLITGKTTPTFMAHNLVMPSRGVESTNQTTSDGIIAKYKILIPIFVPALKAKKIPTKKPTNVQFVKEEVTQLVPVRKIVPHVKEVVRAEKVPQQLITDYVQANGNTVPSSVSDQVYPGERVISSVVKNID